MDEIENKNWIEALQYAFENLDKKGWNSKNNGRYYFVVYNNKEYPNKKVIEFVEKYFHKHKIELKIPSYAKNGARLNEFLEKNGATVISKKESFIVRVVKEKSDLILNLLKAYKKNIEDGKLSNEEYKWILFEKQQNKPSLAKDTIVDELLSMKFDNLIYFGVKSTMKHLNKEKKDKYSELLLNLYDEDVNLADRIEIFSGGITNIYREVEEKLQHHHDERTISTLLSFKYPDKYLLFKDSFYIKLCDLLDIEPEVKGEKYLDYLEIATEIRDKFIKQDSELLSSVQEIMLPIKSFKDPNCNLLTQDFLYNMLEKKDDYYNIFKSVKESFNRRLKNRENSSLLYNKRNGREFQWVQDKFSIIGNDYIHYELYCEKSTVYIDLHLENEGKPDSTELLINLYKSLLEKDYMGDKAFFFDWVNYPGDKNYFQSIRYKKEFSLDEEDVTSDYNIDEMINSFIDLDKIIGDDIRKFLIDNKSVSSEISNSFIKITEMNQPYNQILYGPPGTGKTYHTIDRALSILENKTLQVINKEKREVLRERFENYSKKGQIVFTTFHQSMSYEDFIEGIKPQSKKDNLIYSIEDGLFKQIVKSAMSEYLDVPEAKNNDESFDVIYDGFINSVKQSVGKREGVFSTKTGVEMMLLDVNENSLQVRYLWNNKSKDAEGQHTFSVTKEKLKKVLQEGIDPSKVKNLKTEIHPIVGHIHCELFAVYKSFYDFVIANRGEVDTVHFNYKDQSYKDVKEMFDELDKEVTKNKSVKPYILIIDEINRGNISQIFGELITLIENSKRLGRSESLEVTLPYSKDKFGVPSNLYIIGTMNTADRSVESLDTALRRRFCFEEMLPDVDVLAGKNVNGVILKELLSTINKRVEVLLDRDHTIGHSYFIEVSTEQDLINTFKNNIIPLLQEYFYNDYEKIGMILGNGFFEVAERFDKNLFADFTSQTYAESGNIIRLKKIDEDFNIINALNILQKKK